MRKLFSVVTLVLAYSLGASAAPILYNINFIPTFGPAPASGSFTYDSAAPEFSNFVVIWQGINFDLTNSANNPLITTSVTQPKPGCLGTATGAAASFLLMSGACNGLLASYSGDIGTVPGIADFGFGLPTSPVVGSIDLFLITGVPLTTADASSLGTWTISQATTGGGSGGGGSNPTTPPTPPAGIPEPSTWLMLTIGGGLMLIRNHRG